jgi:anti-sigma B factor antagonist
MITFDESTQGAIAVFRLGGELDTRDAATVRERLTARAGGAEPKAILNLERLDYLDSSGLGALVAGLKAYSGKGGRMVLVNPRQAVRHIFDLTRMTSQFTIYASEAEALSALTT